MKIGTITKSAIAPITPGTYFAVCTGAVYLGEQYSETFKKYSNQLLYIFQLPTETIEIDGEPKPRQMSKTYNVAAGKKSALRAMLSAWNGVQYDDASFRDLELFDQVGKTCMLTTVLNDSGEYANIAGVAPLIKGYPTPEYKFEPLIFNVDEFDKFSFDKLPEWIQRKVQASTQWQKQNPPSTTVDFEEVADDADLPF